MPNQIGKIEGIITSIDLLGVSGKQQQYLLPLLTKIILEASGRVSFDDVHYPRSSSPKPLSWPCRANALGLAIAMRPGISSLIHDTVLVEYPSLRGIRVWPRFCGLLFEECSTPKPKVWRESRPPHAPVRIQHQLHALKHMHILICLYSRTPPVPFGPNS
jgi:hypothetical protein